MSEHKGMFGINPDEPRKDEAVEARGDSPVDPPGQLAGDGSEDGGPRDGNDAGGGSGGGGGASGGSGGGPGASGDSGESGKGKRGRGGRWVLFFAILIVVGGAGFTWWYFFRGRSDLPDEPVVIEEFDEQGTRSITLYFGNRQGDGFVSERRTIQAFVHRDEEIEAVVAELLRGPRASGAVKTWPKGTRLRGAFYDEEQRLLYLDFNSALVTGNVGGSTMETMTLSCVLRTIAIDFPEVEGVQFLIDGLEVETLAGHIDLTRPFRTKDWL